MQRYRSLTLHIVAITAHISAEVVEYCAIYSEIPAETCVGNSLDDAKPDECSSERKKIWFRPVDEPAPSNNRTPGWVVFSQDIAFPIKHVPRVRTASGVKILPLKSRRCCGQAVLSGRRR